MLQLSAHISAQDLEKHLAFVKTWNQQQNQFKLASEFKVLIICLLIGLATNILLVEIWRDIYVDKVTRWLFALSFFMLVISVAWTVIWIKKGGMAAWFTRFSGDYEWELNAQGISTRLNTSSNFTSWSEIIAFVESPDAWYFYLRKNLALSIPKSASDNPQSVAMVVAEYWRKHPDNAGLTLQSDFASGIKQKSFWADLSTNLLGGLQLAFFAKTNALAFKVRTSQWLTLILFDILIIAYFDYCTSAPNPQFNLYGITDYSTNYLLLLLASISICYFIAAKQWLARLMVMLLAATFATELFYLPIRSILMLQTSNGSPWLDWLVWAVYIIWLLVVVGRTIQLLFNYPLPTISLLTSIYSFFVLAIPGILTQQQFFIENFEDEIAQYKEEKIDIESTYYNQTNLVTKALESIKPGREGVPDIYFIGLAGASYQDVFINEVQFVQKLFDQHFDTENRSILLVNHKKTIATLPLGNLPNLSAVFDGVAKKMNKDDDILFLFLSSHGSAPSEDQEDYEISTDFYPLELNNIEAKKLKAELDFSGIKNRVIIVSSCHSGGFIDVLKDENSLIMTAARKDRSSFGCSNDEKYTYFGDAYFVQSLSKAATTGNFDFSLAFENAKKIISQKEYVQQKDSPPSEPQIFEGAAIKAKLAALQARLKGSN